MGTVTLLVEGTTVGTAAQGRGFSVVRRISEADSARLIAAYAKSYAGAWKDADGSPRAPSIEEVLLSWWDGVVSGTVAHVQSVEQGLLVDEARSSIAKIAVIKNP